jgi:hypothetical protein
VGSFRFARGREPKGGANSTKVGKQPTSSKGREMVLIAAPVKITGSF